VWEHEQPSTAAARIQAIVQDQTTTGQNRRLTTAH
jgi:hypothetical protein